jgi:transposase InsO family protein
MIRFFEKWGKPLCLRVDNGQPFGSPESITTSALSLYLIACNIAIHLNRPHTPQQNGKVERQQGTSIRWAELSKCKDLETAQRHLEAACQIQRERYPVGRLGKKTRLEVFPELYHNPRTWQQEDFDAQRVYEFLAKKQYVRKVSSNGQITIFTERLFVGSHYKAQYIALKFDAFTVSWEISDANGQFIKSLKTQNLAAKNIENLTVFQ